VEACRLVALAVAPVMPGLAPRVMQQLGHDHVYAADGNGGPDIRGELAWGAHVGEAGTLTAAVPLFPRLEMDVSDVADGTATGKVRA